LWARRRLKVLRRENERYFLINGIRKSRNFGKINLVGIRVFGLKGEVNIIKRYLRFR
jgi:hypothetical protein